MGFCPMEVNGKSPSWQWTTGVLIVLLGALITVVWGSINARFDGIDKRLDKIDATHDQTILDRAMLLDDHVVLLDEQARVNKLRDQIDIQQDWISAQIHANRVLRDLKERKTQ